MEKEVTGMMVYYYYVCKRKLWYFYHEIYMEQGNESVQIGKILDESSYKRDEKHINIDNVINVDFIRNSMILHEVKKSRSIEHASIWQVKYYLYYLQKKGVVGLSGKIDYPLLKKSVDVTLDDKDIEQLEQIIVEIERIVKMELPESVINSRICKSCAYYDLCFV